MSQNNFWPWLMDKLPFSIKPPSVTTVLTMMLWAAGPVIAWLVLPIEGEWWASLMPEGNTQRAYWACFTLDCVCSVMVYFFTRIQQSEKGPTGSGDNRRRGSKRYRFSFGILGFAGVGVVASWGVSWQQVCRVRPDLHPGVAAANAAIPPLTQLGVSFTQALLGGKFDKPESEPKAPKLNRGQPDVNWWRAKYGQLDGERAAMTPERVRELALTEWERAPGRTTLYNWSQECIASAQQMDGNGQGGDDA